MALDFRNLTDEQKSDMYLLAFIVVPIILTLFLVLSYDNPKDEVPYDEPKTWKEVMSPELRQKTGYDPSKRIQGASSNSEFDKEDIHDVIDYNGGLDGEYSDIDFHDIEDYYAD